MAYNQASRRTVRSLLNFLLIMMQSVGPLGNYRDQPTLEKVKTLAFALGNRGRWQAPSYMAASIPIHYCLHHVK
jgi:hypothetical protein